MRCRSIKFRILNYEARLLVPKDLEEATSEAFVAGCFKKYLKGWAQVREDWMFEER